MRGVTYQLFVEIDRMLFQLTRLMRGVTFAAQYDIFDQSDFNSHASCEA